MSNTVYPGAIDSITNPTGSNTLNSPDHALQHGTENDAITAIETKVGIDGSAVTTTVDYKLSGVPATDKAASKTGTETLTNKTLGSGTGLNLGSDATGDTYYRNSGGALTRLPIGSSGQILDVSPSNIPEWIANPAANNGSTTVKGVFEEATQAEVDAGTITGGTGADLTIRPDAIRAKGYTSYIADTGSVNAYVIAPVPAIASYTAANGWPLIWKAINANTTTSTLNVNTLGTKTIKKYFGAALVVLSANDIIANQIIFSFYDLANDCIVILNPNIANALEGSAAVNVSGSGTSFTQDDTGVVTLVLTKAQRVMLIFAGQETGISSNAQSQAFSVQFNVDSGTIISGYSVSYQPTLSINENGSCTVITASLTAASHTFNMRITGSSASSMSRTIAGTLYAVAIN